MKTRKLRDRAKRLLLGLWVSLSYFFRRTYVANVCKHRTKLVGWTKSFGKRYVMGMPTADNGKPDHCLACIGKMAIRCAWCGGTIYVTDDVTLCYASERTRPDATHDKSDPRLVVGCRSCAEMGRADCCAHWMPPGEAICHPTPIDELEAEVEAGGCPVVITTT